jgi:ATP-binding cassette subfamily F protein 3
VLIISHDRHLIEATVDKLWIAEGGTIHEFDDDLEGYQRMLTSAGNPRGGGAGNGPQSKEDRKAQRQDAASKRAEIAPLRKSIKDAEQKIARLRNELAKVDNILADPKIYDGAPERIILLGKDKARFESDIAKAEESWLMMSAQLEDAEKANA